MTPKEESNPERSNIPFEVRKAPNRTVLSEDDRPRYGHRYNALSSMRDAALDALEAHSDAFHRGNRRFVRRRRESIDGPGPRRFFLEDYLDSVDDLIDDLVDLPRRIWGSYRDARDRYDRYDRYDRHDRYDRTDRESGTAYEESDESY
jgi:hypothetical protein